MPTLHEEGRQNLPLSPEWVSVLSCNSQNNAIYGPDMQSALRIWRRF